METAVVAAWNANIARDARDQRKRTQPESLWLPFSGACVSTFTYDDQLRKQTPLVYFLAIVEHWSVDLTLCVNYILLAVAAYMYVL